MTEIDPWPRHTEAGPVLHDAIAGVGTYSVAAVHEHDPVPHDLVVRIRRAVSLELYNQSVAAVEQMIGFFTVARSQDEIGQYLADNPLQPETRDAYLAAAEAALNAGDNSE